MNTLTKKKLYSGIDLFKLIASILIVLLHATETQDWAACEVKFVITRFAVPFFFIASGFFFYKGLERSENSWKYFIKYEKNILIQYAVWALIITLPFCISSYIQLYEGSSPLKIIFILIRRLFIAGSGPYWYLLAMAFSAPIIYLFHIKKKTKLLGVLVIICILLEIMYSSFRGIFSNISVISFIFKFFDFVYSWEFNFVMYGIPFMGIGYFIAKTKISFPKRISLLLFVFATLVRVLEYNLPKLFPSEFWNNNTISVAFILQAFSFFMFSKELSLPFSKGKSLALRQLSSFIYFTHTIFMYDILDRILKSKAEYLIYEPWFIFPKMIITLIPCVLLFIIIKKINNKHLNVLING